MDDFENKTPEMQEPVSSEDNIPETPETAETIPAEPTVSDEPAAPAEPTVPPEPTVSDAPTAEPLPNAEQAPEAQPIPNVNIPPQPQPVQHTGYYPPQPPYQPYPYNTQPNAPQYGNPPYGYANYNTQPQPGQYPPPYGQGAYPPPCPQNMQNPYPHPAPQKRKMPLGLRILIIVMSVLVAGSVIGFASYGIYAAVNRDYGVTTLPGDPLIPNFPHENDGSDSETPGEDETPDADDSFTPPDIAVTPNTEGITLDKEPNTAELDIDAVYDKVIPSTVLVITQSGETQGTGTGIFATEDGYIITNSHVILNSKSVSVQVKTYDGELHDAVVVGFDKTTDLAVLKIDGTGYMPAEFGDSDDLRMGQWVVAIGNPGGEQFSGSITRGVISGLNRSVGSYSSNGMTYIQTDAAVNPGNSGGPILDEDNRVVGVTVSKFTQADNMGFGIRVETLHALLDTIGDLDRTVFQVQCGSCEELIAQEEEYCPSCGDKLPEGVFEEREQSPLGGFVESAIEQMGVNPVLARDGYDSWLFHKGSSEIRIFVYDNSYLFSTSPINLLPKKEVEPVLDYMLSEDFGPYKLGIEGRQIYIAYRIHLSDITDESEEEIRKNIVDLAFRADAMDNMLVERFGCEFSEYSKADAQ